MSDLRFMPIQGVAPARIANRSIVGPFFTAAGFRGWYLACFADSIVPVPQGLSGFWLAVSGFHLPIRGMGSLLANVMYGYGPACASEPKQHWPTPRTRNFASTSASQWPRFIASSFTEESSPRVACLPLPSFWKPPTAAHWNTASTCRISNSLHPTPTDVPHPLQIPVVVPTPASHSFNRAIGQ